MIIMVKAVIMTSTFIMNLSLWVTKYLIPKIKHLNISFSKPADHIFSEEVRAKAKIKREAREKELKAQWEMEAAQN